MFHIFKHKQESNNQENSREQKIQDAMRSLVTAEYSPEKFIEANETDEETKSVRGAIEIVALDPDIRYADIGATPDQIQRLFGIEIRLRFDAKESNGSDLEQAA